MTHTKYSSGWRKTERLRRSSLHLSLQAGCPYVSPVKLHPVVAYEFISDFCRNRNGNEVFELPRKIFGKMRIPNYGVSMIAYTKDADGIKLWVAKRAESKAS